MLYKIATETGGIRIVLGKGEGTLLPPDEARRFALALELVLHGSFLSLDGDLLSSVAAARVALDLVAEEKSQAAPIPATDGGRP